MQKDFLDKRGRIEKLTRTTTASWDRQAIKNGNTKKRIKDLLKKLVAHLSRLYEIERASFAFFSADQNSLCVTHMLTGGAFKSSLTLTLPGGKSLLYQVLMQGYPVVDNYPELITGNIIEKKILMTSSTASVLVVPLVYDGVKLGVLSFGSPEPAAFGPYLEGVGEEFVQAFVKDLMKLVAPVSHPA